MSKAPKEKNKAMAQRKLLAPSSEPNEILPMFTNTTCTPNIGTTSWEDMYNIFKEEEPRVVERNATKNDSTSTSETTWINVANSHLHRIPT